MALRLRSRQLLNCTGCHTVPVVDTTGGIGRLEMAATFSFWATLLPPQRRVARSMSGIRLAVTWILLPSGDPGLHEQDHVYFPGDSRAYVITSIKKYPRHLAYNIELKQ